MLLKAFSSDSARGHEISLSLRALHPHGTVHQSNALLQMRRCGRRLYSLHQKLEAQDVIISEIPTKAIHGKVYV